MVLEAGADLLLHTWITDATVAAERISTLGVVNKSGHGLIYGKIFVDATGDADVASFAGAELAQGRDADGATQPMTMNFRLGGVDLELVRDYMQQHPAEFYPTTRYDLLEQRAYPTACRVSTRFGKRKACRFHASNSYSSPGCARAKLV